MTNSRINQSDFDNEFIEMMAEYAEALNVPLSEMMQRMLIRRFAEDRAIIDVYGTGGADLVVEFMDYEGMEPKDLFKQLYFMKRREIEIEVVNNHMAVPWEACQEDVKEILTRHGYGPIAEQKKAEEKRILEEGRKKYNIPKRKPGQNSTWEE